MNTLKLKVLLILTNRPLWQHVRQSMLIWIATSFLGSAFLWATGFIGLKLMEVLMLSLVFSAPAVACLIPTLHFVSTINNRGKRIVTSLISLPILCALIIAFFLHITRHYPISQTQLLNLLLPYIFAAHACFFFIARKTILAKAWPKKYSQP
jgi:Kef-type K+ transport system membrane component KefB